MNEQTMLQLAAELEALKVAFGTLLSLQPEGMRLAFPGKFQADADVYQEMAMATGMDLAGLIAFQAQVAALTNGIE